jgi:hypothetical protein
MFVRKIEPGERISELRGGARRGVLRTPIPVALDGLANQGLLDLAAGGGFVVKEFTLADILGRHRNARVTGGHGGRTGSLTIRELDPVTPLERRGMRSWLPPSIRLPVIWT